MSSHGPTAESTKDSILTIRRRARAYSTGLMAESTRETGRMGSSMASAFIPLLQERPREVNGMKERELLGLIDIFVRSLATLTDILTSGIIFLRTIMKI